jgi:MFS family permease
MALEASSVQAVAASRPLSLPEAGDSKAKGAAAAFAAMVGLTWGVSTIALMGLGVFIRPLQMEFGWTRAQVALVATVINLAVVVMSPIQGMLVDKFGSRRVILPSLVIFSVGLMLLYYLPGRIEIFYLSWAVLASLSVGLLPGGYLKVVGTWFSKRLGLAMGLANGGIGLGNILVPLVAAAVIAAQGVGSAPFRVLVAAFFLLGLVNTALITQQVPLLIDAGLTPHKAAFVQSMFGVSLLIGRLGAGYLLDRIFAPVLIIVVALGAAAACLMYSVGVSGGLIYLPAALIGLVIGAEFDVLGYTVKRYFGLPAFGKIYGVIFSIFQLGGALGAAVFALSRDASGNYRLGLYAAAGALVLASVAFACLPKYPVEDRPNKPINNAL